MASIERVTQELNDVKAQLEKAETALKEFEKDEGLELKRLRRRTKGLDEDDQQEKARPEEKEKEQRDKEKKCIDEVVKWGEALRAKTTQPEIRRPRSPSSEPDSVIRRRKVFEEREKNVHILENVSPSYYASSSFVDTVQETRFRHHRPISRSDIPIRFYCKVFETFRNSFYNDTPTLSDNEKKYVELIKELSPQLLRLEITEKIRENLFKKFLTHILTDLNPVLTIESHGYETDGTVIKRVCGTEFLLLNLELKTDWGTRNCSYLQKAAYYVKFMKLTWKANEQYIEHTCYPSFLVTLNDQELTISGAIISDYYCLDKLTPAIPLDMAFYDCYTARMAGRAISALVTCLQDLQDHYTAISNNQDIPKTFCNGPFPRLPTQIESLQNLCYVSRIGGKNLWLAKADLDGSNQYVVIKFTPRYCKEAHDACSDKGIAPKIVYFEELDDGWSLVIMECLECYSHLDKVPWDKRESMRTPILDAVNMLHSLGFVHGDLRGPNILLGPTDDVKLIDFEWAGSVGEAKYPESLNQFVDWHQEAGLHKKIEKSHDLHLVRWALAGLQEVKRSNLCAWNKEY
ncbi:hypothetical protein G9A89_006783 [Geosiphon pyriformis]|nr:hypothetical protein G9A89_006783 [Geosiphon pyriformis]